MKRSLPLVLAPLLTLAACAERGPSEGSPERGTVEGRVLLGPTCPVVTEDTPCPDEPLAGEVVQLVAGDVVVASAVSDPQGRFSFEVEPGRYRLMWAPDEDVGIRFARPTVVTVVAGQTVSADLLIDSGIR